MIYEIIISISIALNVVCFLIIHLLDKERLDYLKEIDKLEKELIQTKGP